MSKKRTRRGKRGAGGAQVPALPLEQPKPRGPGGRPPKFGPELTARIQSLLRKGMPRVRAARRAGIAVSTFMAWMNEFPEFSEAVHDAEDEWVEKAMGKVSDLVDSRNERVALAAAKFGLSYRFREDFSKRVEQTGEGGGPVEVKHSGQVATPLFTDEQIASMSASQLEAVLKVELEARRARGT